ncbi:MAG: response regulator [Deltaproteobacteria bacterium]|nr:response regulator [Deltaproteobacteria bacterium]
MSETVTGSVPRARVLVVDDDDGCRRAVARTLDRAGMAADLASGVAEATGALAARHACIVTEFRLADGAGVDLLSRARDVDPDVGRVVLTGVVDPGVLEDAVNRGAVHAFFGKPWDPAALVQGIRATIERCRLARENRLLVGRLTDRNRELERLVAERTAQLERAKRELEAIFDAWEGPVALTAPGMTVIRANRAYAARGRLGLRDVPGRRCHEVLFGAHSPCPGCPLAAAATGPARGAGGPAGSVPVEAQPVGMPSGSVAFLCRYAA